jgi:hypothetical protein
LPIASVFTGTARDSRQGWLPRAGPGTVGPVRNLTYSDAGGSLHLKSWALPLVVAAIAVPIVLAILLGVVADMGIGLGLAAGAAAVAILLFAASRALPRGRLEVAARRDAERRLLVVATVEVTPRAAEQIAELAGDAADVRVVVPLASRRLDRWLSAEDSAREAAQDALAHSAGALVAAGLPVSGSLGDSDPAQALEDELRGFSADQVVLLSDAPGEDPLGDAADRLGLPLTRIGST